MLIGYCVCVGVQQMIWLGSLYMIFVRNHRRKKQTFVKVIWLFVSLSEINQAFTLYCLATVEHDKPLSDDEEDKILMALEWL